MDEVFSRPLLDKENALPIKYENSYSVTQANKLVRSPQDDLSLLEAKFIRLVIAQVVKEDTDLKTYSCSASKLADFLGISRQAVHKTKGKNTDKKEQDENSLEGLEAFTKNLLKKTVHIKKESGKKGFRIFQWITSADYSDGIITVKLNDDLKPYLIGLNELFTSYGYEEIKKLPTYYAIRLYELLYSYSSMTTPNPEKFANVTLEENEILFTVDYLREYFNCTGKYPQTGDFIKKVIVSSLNEMNQNTAFPCSHRLIKEGKKITKVVFKLYDWNSEAGQAVIKRLRGQLPAKQKNKKSEE